MVLLTLLTLLLIISFLISRILYNAEKSGKSRTGRVKFIYLFKFLLNISITYFSIGAFRILVFDIYQVSSNSMEKELFAGDYVWVDKLRYGPWLSQSFGRSNFWRNDKIVLSNYRGLSLKLPSLKDHIVGNIVVFNSLNFENTFVVKRIVALPGDSLEIKNSILFCNGNTITTEKNISFNYRVISENGVTEYGTYSNKEIADSEYLKENAIKMIDSIPNFSNKIFPWDKQKVWTIDNYGPILIPKKGMSLKITPSNIEVYRSIIVNFEDAQIPKTQEFIYTFNKNYFFLVGDNRHNSFDSRNYGFIPENYIQGRVIRF